MSATHRRSGASGVKLRFTRSGAGGVRSVRERGWCEPSFYAHRTQTARLLASDELRAFWRTSRPEFSVRSGSSEHRRSLCYLCGYELSPPKAGRPPEPERKPLSETFRVLHAGEPP